MKFLANKKKRYSFVFLVWPGAENTMGWSNDEGTFSIQFKWTGNTNTRWKISLLNAGKSDLHLCGSMLFPVHIDIKEKCEDVSHYLFWYRFVLLKYVMELVSPMWRRDSLSILLWVRSLSICHCHYKSLPCEDVNHYPLCYRFVLLTSVMELVSPIHVCNICVTWPHFLVCEIPVVEAVGVWNLWNWRNMELIDQFHWCRLIVSAMNCWSIISLEITLHLFWYGCQFF